MVPISPPLLHHVTYSSSSSPLICSQCGSIDYACRPPFLPLRMPHSLAPPSSSSCLCHPWCLLPCSVSVLTACRSLCHLSTMCPFIHFSLNAYSMHLPLKFVLFATGVWLIIIYYLLSHLAILQSRGKCLSFSLRPSMSFHHLPAYSFHSFVNNARALRLRPLREREQRKWM